MDSPRTAKQLESNSRMLLAEERPESSISSISFYNLVSSEAHLYLDLNSKVISFFNFGNIQLNPKPIQFVRRSGKYLSLTQISKNSYSSFFTFERVSIIFQRREEMKQNTGLDSITGEQMSIVSVCMSVIQLWSTSQCKEGQRDEIGVEFEIDERRRRILEIFHLSS